MIMERILAAVTAKAAPIHAETADTAESAQSRWQRDPQPAADSRGKLMPPYGLRIDPQAPAEATSGVATCFPHIPRNPLPERMETGKAVPACTLEWLHEQGCNVLPDDVRFLESWLPRGSKRRNTILLAYVDTWLDAMKREPREHRKDNRGRFTANTRLREGKLE